MVQRQQAKEKLHKLVAPLLAMHNAEQLSLQALGAIQPKLSLSFSEVGATLKDGTIILQGVTGHFNNAKVRYKLLYVAEEEHKQGLSLGALRPSSLGHGHCNILRLMKKQYNLLFGHMLFNQATQTIELVLSQDC